MDFSTERSFDFDFISFCSFVIESLDFSISFLSMEMCSLFFVCSEDRYFQKTSGPHVSFEMLAIFSSRSDIRFDSLAHCFDAVSIWLRCLWSTIVSCH